MDEITGINPEDESAGMKPTKAKALLLQFPKIDAYINRLRKAMTRIVPSRVDLSQLSPESKIMVDALKALFQQYIDEAEAQKKCITDLIKRVPDPEMRFVLELRYGLGMKWEVIMDQMGYYDMRTVFRRHGNALLYIEQFLEEMPDSNEIATETP